MPDPIATQDGEGAGGEPALKSVAEPGAQAPVQGQEPSQVQVGEPGTTSSASAQGRSKGNWATERIIERALKKQAQEFETRITALLQKNQPPVATATPQSDTLGDPDYNNLNQWLKSAVEKLLQAKLAESLPQHLNQFKGELQNVSKTQEARNFLLSQNDIGESEDKLAEIEQIMKDNMLDYAAVHRPLEAVRKAVDIWRRGKTNPNAPTKEQLSTVSGGTGIQAKRDLSIDELKELQRKIASGLPEDEQEKVFAQVDALLK